jgi:hypothetical protein
MRFNTLCFLTLLGLLCLGGGIAVSLAADDKPKEKKDEILDAKVDPVDKPRQYHVGASKRYCIWYDKDGWHMHTTTTKELHRFKGSIHVEGGNFAYFSGGSALEAKKKSKNKDYGYFNQDRGTWTFDYTTAGHEDVVNFKLSAGATRVRFFLKVDDQEDPELIFIGKDNKHPEKANFYLPARPDKK